MINLSKKVSEECFAPWQPLQSIDDLKHAEISKIEDFGATEQKV